MKRFLMAIVAMVITAQTRAADTSPPPLTPDCHYLFIVDTSLSMARLQEQVSGALYRMISTGLDGQMVSGEVFTIWTFNEDVQQREYPLNSWTPELQRSMGDRALQFMQAQRFRRTPNMRALINAVYQARRICPRLAVFLISNGQEVLVGTPFDRNINVGYGRRFEELRAAKVPFLTTLLCQDGDFVGWSVGAANEPIRLPSGANGETVVGRGPQPNPSVPVVTASRPPPVMNVATSKVVPLMPKQASPVATVRTNRAGRPPAMRPPIITIQGGPEPERKVIDLVSKGDRPKGPLVVKPTEIAPKAKVKMAKTVFRKTNDVPQAVNPKPLNKAAAAKAPGTNRVVAAEPPTKQNPTVAPPRLNPARPVAEAPPPPPVKLETAPIKTPVVKTPVVVPPEPRVVIQVVTQVVMVPIPSLPAPAPKPAETAVVTEPKVPAAKPEKVVNVRPEPIAVIPVVPVPKNSIAPAVPMAPPEAKVVAGAVPPPVITPESPPPTGLGLGAVPNMMAWVYLGLGILVLLIAVACIRKLATRPIEASAISQSMERRDNG